MHFLLLSSLVEWNHIQAGEFYFPEAFLLENKMKAVLQIQPPSIQSGEKPMFDNVLMGSNGSCGSSRLLEPSL